ncbi:MAG: divergent polysaccharide deacetylase family protein, partial [Calditrichaeota bacterium]|nr:divergent polysaccharide deacetylase family protein [Calditrichota bacterium]
MNKRKKRPSTNYRKTTRKKASTNVRRRRSPKKNQFFDTLARYIRLLLLIGLSVLLIYFLFKPGNKSSTSGENAADSSVTESIEAPDEPLPAEESINPDELPTKEKLDFYLNKIYTNFNIKPAWVKKRGTSVRVRLPADLPAIEVIVEIIQIINEMDLDYFTRENLANNTSQLLIADKSDTLLALTFVPSANLKRKLNRIAIIIDDFGYYQNAVSNSFLALNFPITLSIIPGQRHSRQIKQKAQAAEKEVMIHLPMEPLVGEVEHNGFTIMTEMSDEEITRRIRRAVEEIPEAVAVNNHMGSKATADARVMDVVCRELKKYNLMFVDSRTTSKTVAERSAQRYNLPFLRRMVFLEAKDQRDEDYITRQFRKSVAIAKKKGYVVVIGHPYPETLHVLQQQLPELENQGVELVP